MALVVLIVAGGVGGWLATKGSSGGTGTMPANGALVIAGFAPSASGAPAIALNLQSIDAAGKPLHDLGNATQWSPLAGHTMMSTLSDFSASQSDNSADSSSPPAKVPTQLINVLTGAKQHLTDDKVQNLDGGNNTRAGTGQRYYVVGTTTSDGSPLHVYVVDAQAGTFQQLSDATDGAVLNQAWIFGVNKGSGSGQGDSALPASWVAPASNPGQHLNLPPGVEGYPVLSSDNRNLAFALQSSDPQSQTNKFAVASIANPGSAHTVSLPSTCTAQGQAFSSTTLMILCENLDSKGKPVGATPWTIAGVDPLSAKVLWNNPLQVGKNDKVMLYANNPKAPAVVVYDGPSTGSASSSSSSSSSSPTQPVKYIVVQADGKSNAIQTAPRVSDYANANNPDQLMVFNSASLTGTDINGKPLLWSIDLRTGTVTASYTSKGATKDSAFSPSGVEVGVDGRYAIANIGDAVAVVDLRTGASQPVRLPHPLNNCIVSPDAKKFACASHESSRTAQTTLLTGDLSNPAKLTTIGTRPASTSVMIWTAK